MVASEELSNCFSQFKFLGLSTPIQASTSLFSFKQKRFYNKGSDNTSRNIFLKTLEKKILLQGKVKKTHTTKNIYMLQS